MTITNWCFE